MNRAMRFTFGVLLTVCLCGGRVAGDAAGDYESLFGSEARKVAASRIKSDDAAFADKLYKAAGKMPDSPKLQILLYQKAYQFGSTDVSGCGTALKALSSLERALPDQADQWKQMRYKVVKFRFERSSGSDRKSAGKPYALMLEGLGNAKVAEGDGVEAVKLYKRAAMVAAYSKAPNLPRLQAKIKRTKVLASQQVKLKSLQIKLVDNPKDTAAREELIRLHIVEFDNPFEAVKLLTDDIDEVTRTYVSLSTRDVLSLDKAVCLELGDWCYRKLSKKASSIAKPVVLRMARLYYRRFLEIHGKKDVQSFRTATAIEGVNKELGSPRERSVRTSDRALELDLGKNVKMKLVLIRAGKFMMGSPKSEKDRSRNEGPQREVTISRSFYLGAVEVTQRQYESLMGKNPSWFKDPRRPVEKVTRSDAMAFCAAMSKKTGRRVTLPTEAQWEYACRAGSKTRFGFGREDKSYDPYVWCTDNSASRSHPVGRKMPNAWGLYDMHGNVYEWCRDYYDYDYYEKAPKVDPENSIRSGFTTIRGGSWGIYLHSCRSAHRRYIYHSGVHSSIGFRVVVEVGSATR
ncbi:MAG: formylglycine-generating enzyme family protein [Phycisphaerae bacterium]|nr:formylglycine-generating enzyme family protein [Phycisphaerae bacterium]